MISGTINVQDAQSGNEGAGMGLGGLAKNLGNVNMQEMKEKGRDLLQRSKEQGREFFSQGKEQSREFLSLGKEQGRQAISMARNQGRQAISAAREHARQNPWMDAGIVAAAFFSLGYWLGMRGKRSSARIGSSYGVSYNGDASKIDQSAADALTMSNSY